MIKLLFSLVLLTTLLSCIGQHNTEHRAGQTKSSSIGELVAEIDKNIWAIHQDQKGNYWFGSNGNGVFLYDGNSLRKFTRKDGLIDSTIRGIQEDDFGNIFIETPTGISKYNGKEFTALSPTSSSSNEWKLAPNDLWFNCNGSLNDVYRYDGEFLFELKLPRKDLATTFNEVKDSTFDPFHRPYAVFGIDKDKEGNMWFGTVLAGAFRYDGHSFLWFGEKELSRLDDGRVPGVRAMIQDKSGDFWLSNILHRYKVTSNTSYEKLPGIAPADGQAEMLLPYFMSAETDDENQNLWMLTYSEGIWEYDGKKLRNYQVKDGNMDVRLISMYKDYQGKLWLATENAGVYVWNDGGFEKFMP